MKKEAKKLQTFCNPVTGQVVEAETTEEAQLLMRQKEQESQKIIKEESND
jgi:hypothetical protein